MGPAPGLPPPRRDPVHGGAAAGPRGGDQRMRSAVSGRLHLVLGVLLVTLLRTALPHAPGPAVAAAPQLALGTMNAHFTGAAELGAALARERRAACLARPGRRRRRGATPQPGGRDGALGPRHPGRHRGRRRGPTAARAAHHGVLRGRVRPRYGSCPGAARRTAARSSASSLRRYQAHVGPPTPPAVPARRSHRGADGPAQRQPAVWPAPYGTGRRCLAVLGYSARSRRSAISFTKRAGSLGWPPSASTASPCRSSAVSVSPVRSSRSWYA
ncbi:hypothetical protein FB563_7783 [Streptomyces puniciscabiei]|uniref:Uncharacterized protein n=1 Tax=Streptomyces puniciscabiei TaxID=164348 RepID=A0A542SZ77_9ACTN|nr:hypothetical protein FB563_7783 [Streptomyces puniciscabiei]